MLELALFVTLETICHTFNWITFDEISSITDSISTADQHAKLVLPLNSSEMNLSRKNEVIFSVSLQFKLVNSINVMLRWHLQSSLIGGTWNLFRIILNDLDRNNAETNIFPVEFRCCCRNCLFLMFAQHIESQTRKPIRIISFTPFPSTFSLFRLLNYSRNQKLNSFIPNLTTYRIHAMIVTAHRRIQFKLGIKRK